MNRPSFQLTQQLVDRLLMRTAMLLITTQTCREVLSNSHLGSLAVYIPREPGIRQTHNVHGSRLFTQLRLQMIPPSSVDHFHVSVPAQPCHHSDDTAHKGTSPSGITNGGFNVGEGPSVMCDRSLGSTGLCWHLSSTVCKGVFS